MNERAHLARMRFRRYASLLVCAALPASVLADKPAVPYISPYLADSTYPVTHPNYDFTPTPGPVGPSRRLRPDEIQWKPTGPLNAFPLLYSAPYPNGKRVAWIGGFDRVAKLDADTLEVLTTYSIGNKTYFGNDESERHVATMNKLDDDGLAAYNAKFWKERNRDSGPLFYRLLSRENELYLPDRAADGAISIRVYGETDATQPASEIRQLREWTIPADVSRASIMGMNMTSDGWLVMVTQDGVLITLSRDFSQHHILKLPSKYEERPSQDFFNSFNRNGISTDDQGGIYVVTRDYLHRVQWNGSKLSLDEADGAWSASYPSELGPDFQMMTKPEEAIGSGTTPVLMGWGGKEDHLVLITDGSYSNNLVAFWRDAIPADWKGLPGLDRRIAGITPVHFGISKDEQVQIENSPVIYGYGAYVESAFPAKRVPYAGNSTKMWVTGQFYGHVPGHGAQGGTMIRWDPQARALKTVWQKQTNFNDTVCMVSGGTEVLYCWGVRNREWTLEGVHWNTGKEFHYILGKDHRFNDWMGGPIMIAPNGAVDCNCMGGLGVVRITPKDRRHITTKTKETKQ